MKAKVNKKSENRQGPTENLSEQQINNSGIHQFVDKRMQSRQMNVMQSLADQNTSSPIQRIENIRTSSVSEQNAPIQKKENNTGLPDNLKSGIESLSGYSVDDVKVHYNSPKPTQLHAHAYAQGTDIHLASGQEKHLAHEAWHVVQQKQGRVKPTRQLKGKLNINDDTGLEKEADIMGAKAAQFVANSSASDTKKGISGSRSGSIQRKGTAGNSVVQRQEKEKPSSHLEELKQGLTQLKALVAKEAQLNPTSENLSKLNEGIAQLEEIANGTDTTLQTSAAVLLKEELAKLQTKLPGQESQTPSGDKDKGTVQGVWGLDYLLSWIVENPKTAIAVGTGLLLLIEKVVALKLRKNLPQHVANNLYATDRHGYWTIVDRKITQFAKAQQLDDHDKQALRQACVTALNGSHSENNFLGGTLPAALGAVVFHNVNLNNFLGFMDGHFVTPLDNDVQAIGARGIHTMTVPAGQKAAFTLALKQMPFVQRLYSGKVQENLSKSDKAFKRVKGKAAWKGGGSAENKIHVVDDGTRHLTRDDREYADGRFAAKVKKADRFMKQMVEPAVLNQVTCPDIRVHLRNKQAITNPVGFRAFHSQNDVHVAQNEDMSVIVHEMGHHIEDQLPTLAWSDIQLLLQGRNLNKQKASYIYLHSYEEQRYGGDYPATGKYTSKYYEGGATEVTSMSSEYLSHPQKFKTLITNDPQQAAVILRVLRPTEYASIHALNAFNNYLPA